MSCGERLAKELGRKGFRVTPQRAMILEEIAHGHGHQSAQEVFLRVQKRLPGLNLATVYRTVDKLQEAGMVDLFSTGSDLVRFELRDPDHPHHHLVCRQCGMVVDIPSGAVKQTAEALGRAYAFQLNLEHLTLVGLCDECAGEDQSTPEKKGGRS